MNLSYANHFNVDYIEKMYEAYSSNPDSVDSSWCYFFEGMSFAGDFRGEDRGATPELRIAELIRAYRKWGHLSANIDPLKSPRPKNPQLDPAQYGLSEEDRDREFPTCHFLAEPRARLKDLIAALEKTYCGSIGIEYLHGSNVETERWFERKIEPGFNQPNLSIDVKKSILRDLNEAELFERFLHQKYTGQKRFSLEGGESFIPCMSELLEALSEEGASEAVIGMSHRGRLNVLANIMGKTYEDIFSEFEPNYQPNTVAGDGDVKYHKGFVSAYRTRKGGTMHLSLADNPSHLEAVCPLVQGLVRAHQSLREDVNREAIVPILVHGDASFSGQGVVSETLNMSQLEGYKTGGTIHIIINNQIGFTTDPRDGRSTEYCSDVARQILAPVFHVNGHDPEAIVHVVRIAAAFRQRFHQDVVIDLVCYRLHGHNEGDEASFTQPLMYRKIRKMPSPREHYVARLIEQGEVEAKVARALEKEFRQKLDKALAEARSDDFESQKPEEGPHFSEFKIIPPETIFEPVDTNVERTRLMEVARAMTRLPDGFNAHAKVVRIMETRRGQVEKGEGIDWGTGEALAYATLLVQGVPCRLSGQDVKRGTFSHRHAVIWDVKNGNEYCPLNKMTADQERFSIYNSHLSELAVLGFEFGYSLAKPKGLVIWEAQFGDFSNGAQVIIDQFISSSETKWNRVSNLVLFLPHGYEGQGPEHSSARLERFLQLSADNNIQVANLTEPAQLFHALRRQVLRPFRKPLIIMTPKSLLRQEVCVSRTEDFCEGGFREIIDDPDKPEKATRLILCSGKIYFDLQKKRPKTQDAAIVRVEQLYPLAADQIKELANRYPRLKKIRWVQEESRNMGAWTFMEPYLRQIFNREIEYIGRDSSASPAVGSMSLHLKEQAAIVEKAFE